MAPVRQRALSEETLKTRRALLATSCLLALALILGVDISALSVFGVEITFGQAQLLVVLAVANLYFSVLYTVQSQRDQAEQARLFDIASHDELVGKPVYDRLEAAIRDIEASRRLSRDGRRALAAEFEAMAFALALPPRELDEMSFAPPDPPPEGLVGGDDMSADTAPPDAHRIGMGILAFLRAELAPVEPELAARLSTHVVRMQRRCRVYTSARLEGLERAESFTSLSYLVPTLASGVLTAFVAYGFFDPDAIFWFQGQVDALGEALTRAPDAQDTP